MGVQELAGTGEKEQGDIGVQGLAGIGALGGIEEQGLACNGSGDGTRAEDGIRAEDGTEAEECTEAQGGTEGQSGAQHCTKRKWVQR